MHLAGSGSRSRGSRHKSAGLDSGVYVRVGSTNRRADRELIGELRRFARGETYDEQTLPECDSGAIDFRVASESFAPVRKLKRTDLETLRLMTRHQGRKVPTVGGMLLFGRERARYFPDAWIQAGRFRGTDKTHITDTLEIRSLRVRAVEDTVAFVQKHALHGMEIGAVHRKERWNLPPVAVREAVINAVVHADYAQHGAPIRVVHFRRPAGSGKPRPVALRPDGGGSALRCVQTAQPGRRPRVPRTVIDRAKGAAASNA